MKNLIEALTEIRKLENKIDWGWINDGGDGCKKALDEGYAELVKQPYDEWYGQRDFVRLTLKGKKAIKEISRARVLPNMKEQSPNITTFENHLQSHRAKLSRIQ